MSAFNKVDLTLKEICNNCDYVNTEKCSNLTCLISFSKKLINYAKDNSAQVLKDGFKIIPQKDFKSYNTDLIASSVGEICKLCKECKENHSEECIISLCRRSLENTTLRDNVTYPGSIFMYLMEVSKQNSTFAEMIKKAYEAK